MVGLSDGRWPMPMVSVSDGDGDADADGDGHQYNWFLLYPNFRYSLYRKAKLVLISRLEQYVN